MRSPSARATLVLLFAFPLAAQTDSGKTASIEGVVTDSVTGAPIPRVHVMLNGSIDGLPGLYGATATTDGKFAITGIAPGSYSLAGQRVGFVEMPGQGNMTRPILKADDHKTEVNLKLAPTGSISGRVTDANGEPVEGASVEVRGPRNDESRSTDEMGQFRIGGLAPGRYRVKVSTSDLWGGRPEIRTDGTVEVHNATTYYPSVLAETEARKVEVRPGADTTGVDIQLVRVPFLRVSGKIFGAPRSAENAIVMVVRDNGGEGRGVRPDGSFEIWRLDPGKYKLTGQWDDSDGRQGHTVTANIEVAGSNIDNIELRAVPDSDISGRLEFEDDRAKQMPQQDAPLRTISLEDEDGGFDPPSPVSIDAGYTFHLAQVEAGKYHVQLSWQTAYVKSIRLGSTLLDGSLLDLTSGGGEVDLTLLLAAATGSISGNVRVENGDGVPDVQITLAASDPDAGFAPRFATSMPDGTYSFANLPPGSYKISAGEQNEPRTATEAVDLGDGDKAIKDLKAPPPDAQ